jgi:hypothetical protein
MMGIKQTVLRVRLGRSPVGVYAEIAQHTQSHLSVAPNVTVHQASHHLVVQNCLAINVQHTQSLLLIAHSVIVRQDLYQLVMETCHVKDVMDARSMSISVCSLVV